MKALILLTTIVFAQASLAASFSDTGSAGVQIEPGPNGQGEYITISETRYFELGYPSDDLLKAVIKTKRYSSAEGLEGEVSLELRTNGAGRLDKVRWAAQVKGSEVVLDYSDFVGVREFGCCAAPDTTRLFNRETGKKVEAALGSMFQLDVPNGQLPNRYISVAIDSNAPGTRGGKTYIGTLSYFSPTKIVSRVRVYADLPAGWGTEISDLKLVDRSGSITGLEVRNGRGTLWASDGIRVAEQAYKGFGLSASLFYSNQNESLEIVVDGDKFSEQLSQHSSGLDLEFIN